MKMRRALLISLIILLSAPQLLSRAQADLDCGIVERFDYPIDGISLEHDDFGLFRAGFDGYHSGIDLAFEREGEPVRAAARGRVTFSDPKGWDIEKGVVIIEHTMPDRSVVFSLYGHMESREPYVFPRVGQCVLRGDIIGVIGEPSSSAPHLHYEIRRMRASTGGPGYWNTDPLEGGWLHPIEFTEQWRLRLQPAFRAIVTASSAPVAPPLWLADGNAVYATRFQLEARPLATNSAAPFMPSWTLRVEGLSGVAALPDGRILGATASGQVFIVENGRFVGAWRADRTLRTPPLRVGKAILFLDAQNRAVSYDVDGRVRWQSEPLGRRVERYAVSGDLLAAAVENDGNFELLVLNSEGRLLYAARAPSPIAPMAVQGGGFLIAVGTQVSLLSPDAVLTPLLDTGIALGRAAQVAADSLGNLYVYAGYGNDIYAYAAGGGLRWTVRLPSLPTQPPLLAVGDGCLLYVLTADGALLAYRASDGALRGVVSLYAGGRQHRPEARLLTVLPNELVQFSAGYLSTALIDGLQLAEMSECNAAW
ncbi:MAG: peptidoglycan DD-metalloendopeptidase family protein [Anaerolineae bacterium]|nr:peptidoglycan DD-metalloendopeptidase family protein [Anaerolineae bacterium]